MISFCTFTAKRRSRQTSRIAELAKRSRRNNSNISLGNSAVLSSSHSIDCMRACAAIPACRKMLRSPANCAIWVKSRLSAPALAAFTTAMRAAFEFEGRKFLSSAPHLALTFKSDSFSLLAILSATLLLPIRRLPSERFKLFRTKAAVLRANGLVGRITYNSSRARVRATYRRFIASVIPY